MSTKMPRLLPLELPWMVSPSTPFLELHTCEMDSATATYVQMVAYNKTLDSAQVSSSGTMVTIISEPPTFRNATEGESGPYQLMRIRFTHTTDARMVSAFSDSQVIDELQFDWSLVSGAWRKDENEDIFAFFKRSDESWIRTGICPNPRVYEVLPCESFPDGILTQVPASSSHKRFLILGHDSYVEITAQHLEIQAGQVLAGW